MYAELMRKKCNKCKRIKLLTEFQKDVRYEFGVKSSCRKCLNEYCRIKGFAKRYAAANKEKVAAYQKEWRKNNKARYDESRRQWVRNNRKKVLAETRKYQAAKLLRTPGWLTKTQLHQMQMFYVNCPDGYEVDHISPLQGKEISGLHVPWNLQYLKRHENRCKSNKH